MLHAALLLTISFVPMIAYVPPTAPAWTPVASVVVTRSDGLPFTGSLKLARNPAFILSGHVIVVSSTAALAGDAGTTQRLTVTATQR